MANVKVWYLQDNQKSYREFWSYLVISQLKSPIKDDLYSM